MLFLFYFFLLSEIDGQQIANYVNNGSFELKYNCISPLKLDKAKYWLSIDSQSYGGTYRNVCDATVPLNTNTFQYAKSGEAYILCTIYNKTFGGVGYLKNRMKSNLTSGKTYCVKFYINIANTSPRGIDGFGAYFGDNMIDTITKCMTSLSYIVPQVNNPKGNVIVDTLNWIPISGTFVASGNEKYMVVGNFLADNAIATASINTPFYPQEWTDVCIDDVSCIEMDIGAYAGPDKYIKPGDSTFIGRDPDFAIDPFCIWHKIPNTSVPIATVSGLWVKPVTTTTYFVRQELECGNIKYDTVVVYLNPLGIENLQILNLEYKIYPQPASDKLEIAVSNNELFEGTTTMIIRNKLGEIIREEEVFFKESKSIVNTSALISGIYLIQIKNGEYGILNKRFVISR